METQTEQPKQTFIQRWKEGIKQVTQLQQLKIQQRSNWITIIGLLCGIIVMAFNIRQWWWIEIILGAGVMNQSMVLIGTKQKIDTIQKIEDSLKELNTQEVI